MEMSVKKKGGGKLKSEKKKSLEYDFKTDRSYFALRKVFADVTKIFFVSVL